MACTESRCRLQSTETLRCHSAVVHSFVHFDKEWEAVSGRIYFFCNQPSRVYQYRPYSMFTALDPQCSVLPSYPPVLRVSANKCWDYKGYTYNSYNVSGVEDE